MNDAMFMYKRDGDSIKLLGEIKDTKVATVNVEPVENYMGLENISGTLTGKFELISNNAKFLSKALDKEFRFPFYFKRTRKHKKKRIDKKWRKRYGYTLVLDGVKRPLSEIYKE